MTINEPAKVSVFLQVYYIVLKQINQIEAF